MASYGSSKLFLLLSLVLMCFCSVYSSEITKDGYDILCDSESGDYGCHCPEDDTDSEVNCSSRQIEKLPTGISFPFGVKGVTFANNKIKTVIPDAFSHGTGIDHLDFSRNAIRFISASAFFELGNLESLDLSHNVIWSIGLNVFDGLSFLKTLDLSYNSIQDFFGEIFQPCDSLEMLILKFNPLMILNDYHFAYLKNLNHLDLRDTGINFLRENVFFNNTELKWLALAGNAFKEVPSEALQKLKKLQRLDLSQNPISSIKARAFDGMESLKTLLLSNMNHLTQIEGYAMSRLPSLEEVFLTHNPVLNKISSNAFKDDLEDESVQAEAQTNTRLRRLLLSYNNLQTVSENMVANWRDLNEIDFRGNPWNCDCHISWMATKALPDSVKNKLTCTNPSRFQGRKIGSLGPTEFTCDYFTPAAIIGLSLLVLGAFSLALSGGAFLIYRHKLCTSWKNRKQFGYARVVTTKERVDLEWDHSAEASKHP